jgi:hypothetical protein
MVRRSCAAAQSHHKTQGAHKGLSEVLADDGSNWVCPGFCGVWGVNEDIEHGSHILTIVSIRLIPQNS